MSASRTGGVGIQLETANSGISLLAGSRYNDATNGAFTVYAPAGMTFYSNTAGNGSGN